MFDQLKEEVYRANQQLVEFGLVKFTWGNVSGLNQKKDVMAIKPSGVPYDIMTASDMVLVRIRDGVILDDQGVPIEGDLPL